MMVNKKWLSYAFIFLLMIFYVYYISIDIPKLKYPDSLNKWDFVKSICVPGAESVLDINSHHHQRWASWVISFITCKLYDPSPLFFYISALIPSVLALFIFLKIVGDNFGIKFVLLFFIFWVSSFELIHRSYYLLTTGSALIWLALVIYFLHRVVSNEKKPINHINILLLSLCLFMLYGVKLPYMFILPGVLYLCYVKKSSIPFKIIVLLLIFYVIETIIFYLISEGDLILGRLQALLFNGKHLNAMSAFRIAKELDSYLDKGIFIRWSESIGNGFFIYVSTLLLSIFYINTYKNVNQKCNANNLIYILSVVYISFFIITTFFIISINPIQVGQPLRSRYLAFMQPVCYIIISKFIFDLLTSVRYVWFKIFIVIGIVCILAPNITLTINKKHVTSETIKDLTQVNEYYSSIKDKKCIRLDSQRHVNFYKYVHSYWDDSTFKRVNSPGKTYSKDNNAGFYIPDYCSDSFNF